MKTLREVLFEQHQAVEPRLDAIREQVVADLAPDAPVRANRMPPVMPRRASALEVGWRQFLWSLRWHLAGLSAVWLVVLALSIDQSAAPTPEVAKWSVPSSRQLLAALRENQRQLRELVGAPAAKSAQKPPERSPSPRSQSQFFPTAAI